MNVAFSAAFLVLLTTCGSDAENKCIVQSISSNDYQFRIFKIAEAISVSSITVLSQQSKSPCSQDASFGIIGSDVYVDKGCRATFTICYEAGRVVTIGCDSDNYRERYCNVGGRIKKLTLIKQKSKSACLENTTFNIKDNFIYVNGGCRGDFVAVL